MNHQANAETREERRSRRFLEAYRSQNDTDARRELRESSWSFTADSNASLKEAMRRLKNNDLGGLIIGRECKMLYEEMDEFLDEFSEFVARVAVRHEEFLVDGCISTAK